MRTFSKLFSALRIKRFIPIIGVSALVIFSSIILYEATQVNVTIKADGKKQDVKTHAKTVEELLDEVGIAVGEHDELSYDLTTTLENGMKIDYKSALDILVTINGMDETIYTTEKTVGDFLLSQNLVLSEHDEISHKNDEKIEKGLHLEITEAYPIAIDVRGKKQEVMTTGVSVEELLKRNNIKIVEDDKIKPAMDELVTEDTSITITRVETKTDKETEKIDFAVEKKEDSSLAKGKEKVVSEGVEGTVKKEYKVVFENGKEVERKLVNEQTIEKAKNKVIAIGTKVAESKPVTLSKKSSKSSSSNSAPSGGKTFMMSATAYTADCSGCSGITATGINLKANPNMKVVAVDPNVIPLGTRVWVEGYGNAIAGDTGGSIQGNRIDVHVPSRAAAHSFGQKRVKVKILD